MAPGSVPASGSVCANAVFFSPLSTGSRYFSSPAPDRAMNSTWRTSGPKRPGPRGGQRHGSRAAPPRSSPCRAGPAPARHIPPARRAARGRAPWPWPPARRADIGLHVGPVHRRHLDRDQFAIDEAPHRLLQQPKIFRQIENPSTRPHPAAGRRSSPGRGLPTAMSWIMIRLLPARRLELARRSHGTEERSLAPSLSAIIARLFF